MGTPAPILAALAATAALAGCGGEAEERPAVTTQAVTMSGRQFDPPQVNAAAGAPLAVTNAGSAGHSLKLRKDGQELGGTQVVNPGETQQLQVMFEPGEYEMYCEVPGHEEAGMTGTFTVHR